jgi:hypothetical protein
MHVPFEESKVGTVIAPRSGKHDDSVVCDRAPGILLVVTESWKQSAVFTSLATDELTLILIL